MQQISLTSHVKMNKYWLFIYFYTAWTGVSAPDVWSCTSTGSANAKGKCGQKEIEWWIWVWIQDSGYGGLWDVILSSEVLATFAILHTNCAEASSHWSAFRGKMLEVGWSMSDQNDAYFFLCHLCTYNFSGNPLVKAQVEVYILLKIFLYLYLLTIIEYFDVCPRYSWSE